MPQIVTTLGEIGVAPDGILHPFEMTLLRAGAVWNLTGYTSARIEVWPLATREAVATPGTLTITDAANGVVTWEPGADVYAASGAYEGRAWATPPTGVEEPSGLFRFSIGAAPL